MKVEEIRSLLAQAGYSEEDIKELRGKTALSNALALASGNLALARPETTPAQPVDDLPKAEPEMGSPEWNDYVLSLMRPTEMFNGSPTCAGLRRVSQHLLGDIVSSRPVSVTTNNTNEGLCSTVLFEITFLWKRPICIESDLSNPLPYIMRVFGDCADCSDLNTQRPYSLHPSATASSRAEARCLRKALLLSILSAEELSGNTTKETEMSGDWNSSKIAETQVVCMQHKCNQLGIDFNKFIAKNSEKPLNEIDRAQAVQLIILLNCYQYDDNNKESKTIPEDIKITRNE